MKINLAALKVMCFPVVSHVPIKSEHFNSDPTEVWLEGFFSQNWLVEVGAGS
jgi:hypothetical protein